MWRTFLQKEDGIVERLWDLEAGGTQGKPLSWLRKKIYRRTVTGCIYILYNHIRIKGNDQTHYFAC